MDRVRDFFSDAGAWIADRLRDVSGSAWRKVALAVLVLLALYYPIGMLMVHKVDDSLDFRPPARQTGESASVAMVAALIHREVETHGWVMNSPFFMPPAALDNMPSYQQGMFAAFARFTIELRDQVGRTRGSSAVDPDLEEAAGKLAYPGDIWIFDLDTSMLPTLPSDTQYMKARAALLDYNRRVALGEAAFVPRADNLLATLDRIALDIGASSAALDSHITEHASGFLDFQADDLFYNVKGQAYGYYMILLMMREDFADVIQGRELSVAYEQMLDSFRQLVMLDPLVVTNNEPGDMFPPNHLTDQGFYLLRARTQLREITNILLK